MKTVSPKSVTDRLAAELGPVQFEGLTEHLVRQMKTWVLRGLVQPGERLPPERELARMLNVSRASLRQALKVLHMQIHMQYYLFAFLFLELAAE